MTVTNKLYFDIYNITYNLVEQPSLSFEWSALIPSNSLDAIPSGDYEFSDSPHQIWPRPYLKNYNSTWSVPQAQLVISSSGLSYSINDTSTNASVQISEQCQGVPINQTTAIINGPQNTANFFVFQPNGILNIDLGGVDQVGVYELTIQNQEKLLNSTGNSANQFIYISDDPLGFKIEFKNEYPVLNSSLNFATAYINQVYSFSIVFKDLEGDQVYISLTSPTATIDAAEFINNNK